MKGLAAIGLAVVVFAAGCSERDSASPMAPEPAGKLVVSKTKAGGKKEQRPGKPGGPTTGLLKMEQLRYDQPLVVERSSGKVHIQLEEIQDSRCPDGVACFWEGEAKVVLLAWDEGEREPHRLTLTQGKGAEARGRTGNHTIHLMAVNPYPRAEQTTPRGDYVVLLGVTTIAEEGQVIYY